MTPRPALPTRDEYLGRWSTLHGGAAATGLVGGWLRLSYRVAVPLVRLRASPDLVTVAGLVAALTVLVPAWAGGRWLLLSAVLAAGSGLLDNLDGAVAVLAGRITRWGSVLDSLCDRLADAGYVAAFWLLGAPGWWCVTGVAVAWLHEYLRARAALAGMPEIAVVTVAERPTRVILSTMFLLGAGLYPAAASGWGSAGALAWLTVGLAGLGQLLIVVRRRLR